VTAAGAPSPTRQLSGFLAEYAPDIRAKARSALTRLRQQVPGATEMVYDTFNALVIGFAPGDRPSEAVLSIALYPKWINLYFLDGAGLPDPRKLLKGDGSRVRRIQLDDPAMLEMPDVKALIAAAVADADAPFDKARRRRLVIQAAATKRRPRRSR
jgi:hypothetical protein